MTDYCDVGHQRLGPGYACQTGKSDVFESSHSTGTLVKPKLEPMTDQIPITDLVPEELRTDNYHAIRDKMERNLVLPEKLQRYALH